MHFQTTSTLAALCRGTVFPNRLILLQSFNFYFMCIFSLFETHPEVHDAFMSFRAINTTELEYNAILRAHALRVMGTVDKCIYRLDNRDKLRELMTELGIRHKNYTVKIEFIDVSVVT